MKLKEKYEKEVVPQMMEMFHFQNKFQVPKILKVVLNCGFGKLISDKAPKEQENIIETILEDLKMISGQKPIIAKARKSISALKVKKGQPLGAKVTLRGKRMYDFLERLIWVALPRSKDFKGIDQKCFDQRGNLTIGLREHLCFPEISLEKVKFIFGLEVTIVTNARSRQEAIALFKLLGFPIKQ